MQKQIYSQKNAIWWMWRNRIRRLFLYLLSSLGVVVVVGWWHWQSSVQIEFAISGLAGDALGLVQFCKLILLEKAGKIRIYYFLYKYLNMYTDPNKIWLKY